MAKKVSVNKNTIQTKRSTLICPRCDRLSLEKTRFADHTIDLCPRCAGLWCEPSDWERQQLGPHPDWGVHQDRPEDERAPSIVFVGPSALSCPECQRSLTTLTVGDAPICTIDQCDHCGGVWFDHQEWAHLEALRQWPAELAKLEAPPTAWNWWLQFLLRLPTEFNLRPRRFPVVTVGIIALSVLVFLFQLSADPDRWLFLATRPRDLAAHTSYWTLATSIFLHGGFLHLLGNMYYLYVVGDNVEDALGSGPYLLFYLVCGVLASGLFVLMHWGSSIPLLGASGAIAGVMAAYLLLFRRARLTMLLLFWQVKVVAWIWLGSWLALNLLNALVVLGGTEQGGGVGWWAHIGGFAAGLLLIWPLERYIVKRYPLLQVMRTQGEGPGWVQWA